MKVTLLLTVLLVIILSFFPLKQLNSQSVTQTERRIALVIGNGNYNAGMSLANPENDARSMADILQKLGFIVFKYENRTAVQMKNDIDEFGAKLKGNVVGLFYYAGHGIQAKGYNYLIPVDAQLKSEEQVEYDCVRADRILALMETSGTKINVIILDACRNNPFERGWTRSPTGKGLAFMNAPKGTLIAYATSPGSTASDGSGSNGLYTSAILESITIPNITIETMFKNVRNIVAQKSNNQQMPWESTSLTGDFYFSNRKIDNDSSLINASSANFDSVLTQSNSEDAKSLNNEFLTATAENKGSLTTYLKDAKYLKINRNFDFALTEINARVKSYIQYDYFTIKASINNATEFNEQVKNGKIKQGDFKKYSYTRVEFDNEGCLSVIVEKKLAEPSYDTARIVVKSIGNNSTEAISKQIIYDIYNKARSYSWTKRWVLIDENNVEEHWKNDNMKDFKLTNNYKLLNNKIIVDNVTDSWVGDYNKLLGYTFNTGKRNNYKYQYNEQGQLISESCNALGYSMNFIYLDLDDHQNWTKRIGIWGKKLHLQTRIYNY
jgi:hypothetical protein